MTSKRVSRPPETSSKARILDLVRANPFVSQQELAERLGLSRSAVASHIAQLVQDGKLLGRAYVLPASDPVFVAGGANLDRIATALGPVAMASSNPVRLRETPGGVARNVAENLARLGLAVRLMTAVGDDSAGAALLGHMRELGVDTGASLAVPGLATGTYTAMLQADGELVVAMADMAVVERLTAEALLERRSHWMAARLRVVDGNLPTEALAAMMAESRTSGADLVFVAVSEPKMRRLPASLSGLSLLLLNAGELSARLGRPLEDGPALEDGCRELQAQGAGRVVVTLGGRGLLCADRDGSVRHLPAPRAKVVDVTGAGDAFSAGVIASLHGHPDDLLRACRTGQRLAALTLASAASVAPSLSPALLNA
jgi:pseudouridine kinase